MSSILSTCLVILIFFILFLLLFPIRYFFRDFPEKDNWFKKEQLNLNVYAVHFFKDVKLISKPFDGFLLTAYLKVRLLALKEDIRTSRHSFGISWELEKIKEENK